MVEFDPPLVEGRLVRRYKRFFADVVVGGDTVVAHCPNPGAMTSCAEIGGRVWLEPRRERKLAWRWELAEVGERQRTLVGVNTARANQLVADALAAGEIAELRGYDVIEREVAAGESRLDFRLARGPRNRDRAWVEVKNATMDGGGDSVAFPDCVTARGTRHVGELVRLRRRGFRAVLLFVVSRSGVARLRIADEIDGAYAGAVAEARRSGVEVLAYATELSPSRMRLAGGLPVDECRTSVPVSGDEQEAKHTGAAARRRHR